MPVPGNEQGAPRSPYKLLVTPVRTNERIAVQWFKRFNGRAPDEADLEQLREFLVIPNRV